MGKHSRCVIDTCDNDMQYPELRKKHSNVDGDNIMHSLSAECFKFKPNISWTDKFNPNPVR